MTAGGLWFSRRAGRRAFHSGVVEKSPDKGEVCSVGAVRERPLPEKRALHEAPLRHSSGEITTPVIPAKAGIHFDFSPGGVATTLFLRGVRMRNPKNSPFVFVFDSAPPRSGAKTSERGGEKAKAKMDSGFRRNDGQNQKPGGGAGITSSSKTFSTTPFLTPYGAYDKRKTLGR